MWLWRWFKRLRLEPEPEEFPTPTDEQLYDMVMQHVEWLAEDYEDQRRRLPSKLWWNLAWDIYGDWETMYEIARQLKAKGFISSEEFKICDAINAIFCGMYEAHRRADNELPFWTLEGVRDCGEWCRIRSLARRLLRSLAASEEMRRKPKQ